MRVLKRCLRAACNSSGCRYSQDMCFRYFTLALLLCGVQVTSAEVIQLKERSSVSGKVLAEKRDQVVVDLGFTVLTIPRNQIVKIIKDEPVELKGKPSVKAAVPTVPTPAGNSHGEL